MELQTFPWRNIIVSQGEIKVWDYHVMFCDAVLCITDWLWIVLWSFAAENVCGQPVLGAHHGEAPQRDDPTDGGPGDAVGDGTSAGCHSHHHHSHRYSTLQEVSLTDERAAVHHDTCGLWREPMGSLFCSGKWHDMSHDYFLAEFSKFWDFFFQHHFIDFCIQLH